MHKTGVLLHVYNLGCKDWEQLVWGNPELDQLGTGTKLLELLMSEPVSDDIVVIMYNGPSHRDGISEGAYTKEFLLSRLGSLPKFPRLKAKLDAQTYEEAQAFQRRLEAITVGEHINNTFEEIRYAANSFNETGVQKVIHVAAASHAPRCIQMQAIARERGLIPWNQLWLTVASDMPFAGRSASDTVVIEPPHRADDPLVEYKPTLASVIKPYFSLSGGQQKQFICAAEQAMTELRRATASGSTEKNQLSLPEAV